MFSSLNYLEQVNKLSLELDQLKDSLLDESGKLSPKNKMPKIEENLTRQKVENVSENLSAIDPHVVKEHFKQVCDPKRFNQLSPTEKDNALTSLNKIHENVIQLLQRNEEEFDMNELNTFNKDIQEIINVAQKEKNENSLLPFLHDTPSNEDQLNFQKFGSFIRKSSDRISYTLVTINGKKIGLMPTANGIYARELRKEFPSIEALAKHLKITLKNESADPVGDLYKKMESQTYNYLKKAGLGYAVKPDTSIKQKDLELAIPTKYGPNNRFVDILAAIGTIVHVTIRGLDLMAHANHISMPKLTPRYIVGQSTVNGEESRFWKAVFENSDEIIDFTTLNDDLTFFQRPYINYPDKSANFAPIEVTLEKVEVISGDISYTKYTYHLKNADTNEEKVVTRYHYSSWIDHGTVTPEILDKLLTTFPPKESEQFVHCRAGVGRSGTFVVASFLKESIEKGIITKDNFTDSLEKLVLDTRTQRNAAVVQTEAQFRLLYDYGQMLLRGVNKEQDLQDRVG